jgi:hypothetical protein
MLLFSMQQLAIYADVVPLSVRAGSQLGNDLAIDLNPSLKNELFRLTAARHSRSRKNLLEALAPLFGRFGHPSIIS